MDALSILQEKMLPFARFLGIEFVSASPDSVTARMLVREELCTIPAILHGGAVMSLADTLGGCATFLNLPPGASTATIESKTNFFAPAPVGTSVIGECTALHRGKRTMVWQTRVTSENGRLLAIVTQTQMVLESKPT
jgi:uncharacterized protein (TIGR00369 family)